MPDNAGSSSSLSEQIFCNRAAESRKTGEDSAATAVAQKMDALGAEMDKVWPEDAQEVHPEKEEESPAPTKNGEDSGDSDPLFVKPPEFEQINGSHQMKTKCLQMFSREKRREHCMWSFHEHWHKCAQDGMIDPRHCLFMFTPSQLVALMTPTAEKAMKATKAMKTTKTNALTASAAYKLVAKASGLKLQDVKAAVKGLFALGAAELKKNGSFNIADKLTIKIKKKPATKARNGVNPFTKKACVFKGKPASKTVRIFPTKKFKEMVD